MSTRITRSQRRKLTRFYCNIAAKTKAHGYKWASLEQLSKIKELIINNEENNLFLVKPKLHAKYLSKKLKEAKSDPDSNIEPQYLLERFFAQFDLGKAEKWSDWTKKYPDYDPKKLKWPEYDAQTADETLESTATENLTDPEHHKLQEFRDSVTLRFGILPDKPTNSSQTNSDSASEPDTTTTTPNNQDSTTNSNINRSTPTNGNQHGQPSSIQQNQSSTTTTTPLNQQQQDQENIANVCIQVVQHYIKLCRETEEKIGETEVQPRRMTVCGELLKHIIYNGFSLSDQLFQCFMELYPNLSPEDLRNSLDCQIKDAEQHLKSKGFISATGQRLKPFILRLEENLAVNPNPTRKRALSDPTTNPRPAIRPRLNPFNRILQGRARSGANQQQPPQNALNQHQQPSANGQQQQSTGEVINSIRRNEHDAYDHERFFNYNQQIPNHLMNRPLPPSNPPPNPNHHYSQQLPNPRQPYFPQIEPLHQPVINNQLIQPNVSLNQSAPSSISTQYPLDPNLLRAMISEVVKQYHPPADPLKKNHFHQQISGSINNNARSINSFCSDMELKRAVIKRVCQIAKGPTINQETRELVKLMNSKTNGEIAEDLQGLLFITLIHLAIFSKRRII